MADARRLSGFHVAALAFVLAMLAACGRQANEAAPVASEAAGNAEWPGFADRFIEDYFVLHPSFAAGQGRHEFDGQLPDWSADGIQQAVEYLERSRTAALAFGDNSLSAEQRFQRDYLIGVIDSELFWLREAQLPKHNPAFYLENGLDPSTYVTVPYAPPAQRARAFIKYANAIPGAAAQIRANLQTPLPRTFIDYGVAGFGGLAEFYRTDVPQAFAEVQDEALQKELAAAIESAAQAMLELSQWLEAERPRATESYALGPERFAAMLRMTEGVTTPLDRLEAIGRADLERNFTALEAACRKLAPSGSISACVSEMAADKPEGGAVAGARRQLSQLRQFIVEHDLVSIPGIEEALVDEAPPYRRQNFAYINIPGPYEHNMPSVYYIAPPDPTWPNEEQLAYLPGKADLLFTSIHEVWPGHFLQFLHSNRSPWRFGQIFVGYAFAEGWAHYTEELMIEAGLAEGEPALHVGQLLNALLRNVRYLCAIGLHTQGMTVAECEQMFKEKAYQDAGNARQQAARGTRDPAYLNYTLGKLMIRKLREDWTETRGGRAAWKQFHDEFLSFGGPPIPLVRAQMLPEHAGELL